MLAEAHFGKAGGALPKNACLHKVASLVAQNELFGGIHRQVLARNGGWRGMAVGQECSVASPVPAP